MDGADTSDGQPNLPAPRPSADDGEMVNAWSAVRDSAAVNTDEIAPITKAAIVLSAIGPEVAAEFLKNMNEAALTRTAVAISRIDRIAPEMLDAVIAEFLLSIGTEEEVSGGSQTARRLLAEVLDDTTIDRIMFDVEGGDTRKAWKKLNDISNNALAGFVGAEHPQTAAVILSELRADKAAAVLERLDREFAQQTVLRLSRVPSLEPHVAEAVERVIARDFLSALQRTKRSRRPADLIAGLMNNLGSDNREKFLTFLEGEKPTLHADVLKTMFTFNDIRHRVEPREVAIIVKELDEPELLIALKWGTMQGNGSVEFLLGNLSKRLTERLTEDLEAMPEPTQRDGEAAHQEIVRKIQEMAKAGKISLIEDEVVEE
ncbi:MAG: FliG C-terminal domain-containing protein [Pseudomonadota bacterium]